MVKPLPMLLIAGLLGGCAGSSESRPEQPGGESRGNGCVQADWQAETAPVIGKRLGPEKLEKYEQPAKPQEHGCP